MKLTIEYEFNAPLSEWETLQFGEAYLHYLHRSKRFGYSTTEIEAPGVEPYHPNLGIPHFVFYAFGYKDEGKTSMAEMARYIRAWHDTVNGIEIFLFYILEEDGYQLCLWNVEEKWAVLNHNYDEWVSLEPPQEARV